MTATETTMTSPPCDSDLSGSVRRKGAATLKWRKKFKQETSLTRVEILWCSSETGCVGVLIYSKEPTTMCTVSYSDNQYSINQCIFEQFHIFTAPYSDTSIKSECMGQKVGCAHLQVYHRKLHVFNFVAIYRLILFKGSHFCEL